MTRSIKGSLCIEVEADAGGSEAVPAERHVSNPSGEI
jgi:hypothetical protein